MTLRIELFGTALCGAAGGATAGFGAGAAGGAGAGAAAGAGAGPPGLLRRRAARQRRFDVALHDAAVRAAALHAPEVEPRLLRHAPRERRGEDAFAAARLRGRSASAGCGGLGGVGSRRGDGCVRRAGGLAAARRDAFRRRAFGGRLRGRAGLRDLAAAVLRRGGLRRRWRRAAPPSGTASPGSTSTAIGSLTFTPSVPSPTRILPRTPSSTASTSMVALSVSISAMTSPALTSSPSFFSQRASVPSVMVGERAGIRMLVAMVSGPSTCRSRA